jgi:DNA-binding transcriptional ArsR family regulator
MGRSPDIHLKAKLFRGLADPSRLAVLEALRDRRRCVSDLARQTGLSQPSVSAHLACLQDCGLVSRAREGRFVFYAIAHKEAILVLEDAEAILGRVGDHVYTCTRYELPRRRR